MLNAPILLQPSTAMNTTVTTASQQLRQIYGFAVQAIYTGTTINGTLKLQASIDNINWADISGATQNLSTAGNFLFNINGAFYPWMRAVFSDGGTTTPNARIIINVFLKGI